MTNQSPAEALRQHIIDDLWARALDMTSDDFKDDNDYLKAQSNYKKLCLKQLTAYAATVEREARRDELQTYFDTFNDNNFTPMRTINYCERRLAALQGPQDTTQ